MEIHYQGSFATRGIVGDYYIKGLGYQQSLVYKLDWDKCEADLVCISGRFNTNGIDVDIRLQDFEVNKCLMTAPPEIAEKLVVTLNKLYGENLSIYRSEPFFIEIMPKDIDKAKSLDRMMCTVGLTKDNCICCGDGFNDMTMIRYAGIGVAMENAQPAIKEAADFVTDSNDNDGIVKVIDTFILPEDS